MKISRLNSIEQYVIAKETVSIDELCEAFGVSKNTIRRDLNDLEARGHIAKVYGGVTAISSSGAILPPPVRSSMNSADKNLIGRLAAGEVNDGDTIFIDSGTTTLCMTITKAFMAATGVSLESGMTNTTFLEAEIKRGVAHRASSVYLMADSSKLDKEAVISFCQLRDLTAFVTDRRPPDRYIEFFRTHGIRVLCQ